MKKTQHIATTILLVLATQILSAKNSTVLDLTTSNFSQIIQGNKPVLVKFWASWCGPCMSMAPKYKKASKSYVGKIQFTEVNVDRQRSIARKYKVRSIPTTILFIDGREMDRFTGGLSVEQIKYWANEVIKGRYK